VALKISEVNPADAVVVVVHTFGSGGISPTSLRFALMLA